VKIENLTIKNFRGIRSAALSNLQNMVVIAGQNGSGKSCVLDAIRLLKSVYGGYLQNEWHQWMGEFQINFNNRNDLVLLCNDPSVELRITCEISLHSEEREFIRLNGEELVRQSVWRSTYPETYGWSTFRAVPLAAHLRSHEAEIKEKTKVEIEALNSELAGDHLVGEFILAPGQNAGVRSSKALEIVFGTFRPHHLGVIDYHGPHRMYGRETLQGINLNLDALEQQRSQHALYNYAAKYANVKAEMAGSYIKEILAEEAGQQTAGRQSLSSTLKELFRTFFPDKEFLGPVPTAEGTLMFPVRTQDGATHDLNELSAGEKEVLYGYLRLRNSAPKFSVILLDEPELHLNPRLIKGLPDFYHKHLGSALGNQIWLITHSDALLREVVGQVGYSVFHMQTASATTSEQAAPLLAKEGLEKAVIDLVGDLASYRPDAKLIIFEGENSEFDQKMATALFPALQQSANLVSAGSKQRVRGLHAVLGLAMDKGEVPMQIFSIVDPDGEKGNPLPDRSFEWDVYHIENYLLEPKFILRVVSEIGVTSYATEEDVYAALRECARDTLTDLVRHKLASAVNDTLVGLVKTAIDPKLPNVAPALANVAQRSAENISKAVGEQFGEKHLNELEASLRSEFEKSLAADSWRKRFRGRDVLNRFVARIHKIPYEVFRDLIIARMKDAGFEPEGMRSVINKVLAA
jgi:ABC-type branched-subunit amino acid transport system ATPase component